MVRRSWFDKLTMAAHDTALLTGEGDQGRVFPEAPPVRICPLLILIVKDIDFVFLSSLVNDKFNLLIRVDGCV
jgi:hypothetical protein